MTYQDPMRELNAEELEREDVFGLPDREVLTLVGPGIADGLVAYANSVQNAPVDQGAGTAAGTAGGLANDVQSSAPTQNTATAQNVDSPNSQAFSSQTQYAPTSAPYPVRVAGVS